MAESVVVRATHSPFMNNLDVIKLLQAIQTDLSALTAQFNQLRTDFAGHVHGGVTAGAANTAAAATSSTAVTLNTLP